MENDIRLKSVMSFKLTMLFSRNYQRRIWTMIILFTVIVWSVFVALAPDQFESNGNIEKLPCQPLSHGLDSREPKVLINMKYFLRYLNEYHKIPGWTTIETFYTIWLLMTFQYKYLQKMDGAIGEIGFHHGRLTSYLYLMRHRNKQQKLFAVDVFANKSRNTDASRRGDRKKFLRNVQYYANISANELIIYEGTSLDLNPLFFNRSKAQHFWSTILGKRSCQLLSIDGSHTTLLTYSDLCLISNSLVDGGIVMVDHPGRLGVRDGVTQFLAETSVVFNGRDDPELAAALSQRTSIPNFNVSCRIVEMTGKVLNTEPKCSRLVPILQYANKLYLTTPNYYPHYIEYLKQLNNKDTNFIHYNLLRSTAGNVPIWTGIPKKTRTNLNQIVKSFLLAEFVLATQ